jgi:cysteinyl-tRNA synthetase
VRIKDTLSGEPVALEPGAEVGIYACGPTVYSRIHIGNARPYVVFSVLARFLAREGFRPKLVINVTDVNDKIYDAARAAGVPSAELAEQMIAAYREDTGRLGLGRPDAEPLATETMDGIVELIAALVDSGHAYPADGDVYFRVASFDGYGKLSNRDTDAMDQGEEAGSAALKESPLDFALWKGEKEGEDTAWDSPWGRGRPGWHIECSAMAEAELGTNFAIHGGGSDLVFPHHENEIAQSEAARGEPLARIWMHNGMVLTGPEAKMAKSEGNVFQLHEALDRYGSEAVVDFLLSGHYRQPLAFGAEQLDEARARVERLRNFLREHPQESGEEDAFVAERRSAFFDALADDFNTPRARAELFDLVAEANRREVAGAAAAVADLLDVLGLGSLAATDEGPDPEAQALLEQRESARAERDFAAADELRDRLASMGWEVRDSAEGARLVRR